MKINIKSHGDAIYYLIGFKSEFRSYGDDFIFSDSVLNNAIRVIRFQHECQIPIKDVMIDDEKKLINLYFSIGNKSFIMIFYQDETSIIYELDS